MENVLKAQKIGKLWYVSKQDLEAFLEGGKVELTNSKKCKKEAKFEHLRGILAGLPGNF